MRRAPIRAAVLLALAALAPAQRVVAPADGTFDPLRDVGIDQRLDARLPLELAFRDERGVERRLGELLDGRPAVLVFVYYECPMLCNLVLNGLLRALRVLDLDVGDDFDVLVVSIDPDETPELAAAKKASYLEQYGRDGAARGWHFLTGEEPAIGALAAAAGFRYAYLPERDEYAHGSGLSVVTPDGRLSHYLYGVEYSARDLRLALVESGRGRIGSLADQVLLLCYHYDPRTGKYGLAILNGLRLAGGMTVLGLALLVARLVRRERREART